MPPCVILAGGQAVRMGGMDKCLLPLAGKPLAQHIMDRLRDRVSGFALNANGAPDRFASLNVPVLPDRETDFGPLAGVCAALDWARQIDLDGAWVLILSGDTPFIPATLIERLWSGLSQDPDAAILVPAVGDQVHPLCALWRKDQLADLSAAVYDGGLRSVKDWCAGNQTVRVRFDGDPDFCFFNINSPDDLKRAQSYLKEQTA